MDRRKLHSGFKKKFGETNKLFTEQLKNNHWRDKIIVTEQQFALTSQKWEGV